jgi:hypothetical protein
MSAKHNFFPRWQPTKCLVHFEQALESHMARDLCPLLNVGSNDSSDDENDIDSVVTSGSDPRSTHNVDKDGGPSGP